VKLGCITVVYVVPHGHGCRLLLLVCGSWYVLLSLRHDRACVKFSSKFCSVIDTIMDAAFSVTCSSDR